MIALARFFVTCTLNSPTRSYNILILTKLFS